MQLSPCSHIQTAVALRSRSHWSFPVVLRKLKYELEKYPRLACLLEQLTRMVGEQPSMHTVLGEIVLNMSRDRGYSLDLGPCKHYITQDVLLAAVSTQICLTSFSVSGQHQILVFPHTIRTNCTPTV